MTQTYKERVEALQYGYTDVHTVRSYMDGHDDATTAAAELAAEADQQLASKDAEIAAMAAEVARLRKRVREQEVQIVTMHTALEEARRPYVVNISDAPARKDAEIAALREDAERYRWIRGNDSYGADIDKAMIQKSSDGSYWRKGVNLDNAIDAARKKG